MSFAKNLYIVAAKRTPFGTFGGKLTNFTATDLAVESSKAALAAGKVSFPLWVSAYLSPNSISFLPGEPRHH